ncbi:ferritin-like domain-containing protein [Sparassis latifolia]
MASPTDTNILQFALSLELLENNFYSTGLGQFDDQAFAEAGFPAWVRGRFEQIGEHEAEHVSFLQAALGSAAPQPCTYNFPYTDPKSFAALAMALEGVGASAYLGAAQYISDKNTLTAAGSILAVESRHAGWISSAVLKLQPWDGSFETPLGLSGAFSLASEFIVSCPSTNPPLPISTFPALTVSTMTPSAGYIIGLTFSNPTGASPTYLAWMTGLDVVFTNIDGSGVTTVPSGLFGTVYVGVVSSNQLPLSDASMVTGLAIVEFPFNSTMGRITAP